MWPIGTWKYKVSEIYFIITSEIYFIITSEIQYTSAIIIFIEINYILINYNFLM